MSFGPAALEAELEELLPADASGLAVALSGGPDSATLLLALCMIAREAPHTPDGASSPSPRATAALPAAAAAPRALAVRGLPLRALHVDHGLQSAARVLKAASVALCARLEVPLEVLEVRVGALEGRSVEAAAREARYGRLHAELRPHECLLTAHHQDDQAETVLLQLLRGAGLKGLAGMPRRRRFGAGWHLRPLLEVPRSELAAFAAEQGLSSCTDPMNLDPRFERTYVRTALWPLIERRWPGAAAVIARSARHLAEAQALVAAGAAATVSRVRDGEALRVEGLRSLGRAERIATLRYWLEQSGVRVPSSARLAEALRQMLDAAPDHVPVVAWNGHALRRYRGRIFLTPAEMPTLGEPREWRAAGAPLELPPGLGRLRLERAEGGLDPARLPAVLHVRSRTGGEALRIARGARTRSVRELCQARGVAPWWRDALPFVYAHETLIAVGDLWHNADWCVEPSASGVLCRWEDAPDVQ